VAGTVALGSALTIRPGDPLFYAATLGVAAVWVAGALLSGPQHVGSGRTRSGGTSRGVLQGFVLGLMLLALFLAGALSSPGSPTRVPVEGCSTMPATALWWWRSSRW
jgi:hypothetical protein